MQFSDNRTLCAVQGSTITEGVYICIDKLYTQTTNLAEVCIIYIRQHRLQLMHLAQLIPNIHILTILVVIRYTLLHRMHFYQDHTICVNLYSYS